MKRWKHNWTKPFAEKDLEKLSSKFLMSFVLPKMPLPPSAPSIKQQSWDNSRDAYTWIQIATNKAIAYIKQWANKCSRSVRCINTTMSYYYADNNSPLVLWGTVRSHSTHTIHTTFLEFRLQSLESSTCAAHTWRTFITLGDWLTAVRRMQQN